MRFLIGWIFLVCLLNGCDHESMHPRREEPQQSKLVPCSPVQLIIWPSRNHPHYPDVQHRHEHEKSGEEVQNQRTEVK